MRERGVDVVGDEHALGQRHQQALEQQRAARIVVDDERARVLAEAAAARLARARRLARTFSAFAARPAA